MEVQALQVALDVGCRRHRAAIGTAQGRGLAEFDVAHTAAGFAQLFARIEAHRAPAQPVCVAMEGCNGYARPLDRQVRARGYRLVNVNNLKLARFKERFSGCRDDLRQLARLRPTTLRQLPRVGVKHVAIVTAWQPTAYFAADVVACSNRPEGLGDQASWGRAPHRQVDERHGVSILRDVAAS